MNPPIIVTVSRLPSYAGPDLPKYQTPGSAGMDIYAAEDVWVKFGVVTLVATGMRIAVPHGYEAQVRARSGLSAKHGIFVVNGPGTIDSDYRGEVKVILSCARDGEPFRISAGDRIAQLVFAPVQRAFLSEVMDVMFDAATPQSERGTGGMGSTGVK